MRYSKINIFLLFSLFFVIHATKSQVVVPTINWQHTIANRGNDEFFNDAIQTPDKSIITVGNYGSADYDCADLQTLWVDTIIGDQQDEWMVPFARSGSRMLIVKYDSTGNQIWKKAVGNEHCRGRKIYADNNGGYIIVGYYHSSIYDFTTDTAATSTHARRTGVWIVKIDDNGNILWQKIFGIPDQPQYDWEPFDGSAILTRDGGMIVYGCVKFQGYSGTLYGMTPAQNHGQRDGMIIKLGANGDVLWSKQYGGSNDDWITHLFEQPDGNLQAFGHTASMDGDLTGTKFATETDIWSLKLNSTGNIIQQQTIGSNPNDNFTPTDAIQTNDNGYLIAGYKYGSSSSDYQLSTINLPGNFQVSKMFLIKFNENGTVNWVQDYYSTGLYGTADGVFDIEPFLYYRNAFQIENDLNGGYFLATNTDRKRLWPLLDCSGTLYDCNELKGDLDFTICKLDNNGNILAHKVVGGSDVEKSVPHLRVLPNNGLLLLGSSTSEDKDLAGNTRHPRTNPYDPDMDPWIVNLSPFSPAPLPQRINNLTATAMQSDVQVNWQIPNETNMLHYFIERSYNNSTFFRVGKRSATGNQGQLQSYQYTDSAALTINFPYFYYRIATVDLNGRITYSASVMVYHPLDAQLNASRQTADVIINWSGRYEFSLDHYTLQRSLDGTHFADIRVQQASGASQQPATYSFTDANAALIDTAYLYYRLQFTDTTGAVTYSAVVALHHPMLYSLSGDWATGQINLLSQTKYEQQILRHTLQKSYNGSNFINIDSTNSLGAADIIQNYPFSAIDEDIADLLFRMRYTDSAGNSVYSNVVALHHPLVMQASGNWNNADAQLQWDARYEVAMSHYTVERSFDGTHFTGINNVIAVGNSNNLLHYQFAEPGIDTAYLYYRVMAVDSNGRNWTSNVVVLHHPMRLEFAGDRSSSDIDLSWRTKYERGISSYLLQRSFNGSIFVDLNNTATSGNSDQWQQYAVTDNNAALIDTPYLYYRLLITDSTGNSNYSAVISFNHPMVVHFDAVMHAVDVDVSWTTKYQRSVLSYQVQRSFNGRDFTGIETITANGNNDGLLAYNHTDAGVINMNEAYQYYRLMITDSSGSVQYTDTIAIHHPLTITLNATWNQLNGNITWNTQFEENIQELVLQRSTDAVNYSDISTLPSQGNSDAVQQYHYDDNQLYLDYANAYYYRIKIVYSNAAVTYSDTAQLVRSSNIVVLAPNPTTGRMTIQSNACKGYWVSDMNGQVLQRATGRQHQIDLSRLPTGIYLVTLLMDDNSSSTLRVMKQ